MHHPPSRGQCPSPSTGCEDFTSVYIDDILIFSKNAQDHLQHLREVFIRLEAEAYHVRLAKCQFMLPEVKFLGHILSDQGIKPLLNKKKEFDAFEPPFENAKKVRSFLGLVMWYKSFIPHISTIAAPLFPVIVFTPEISMDSRSHHGSWGT